MRYAVANFSDDGWGRPFRVDKQKDESFRVTSAGKDARFDTSDDISLDIAKVGQLWPRDLRAYYLRRERGDAGVSYHRCGPRHGVRRVPVSPTARGLKPDPLFGVVSEHKFPKEKREALHSRIATVIPGERDALVLVVYQKKDIGVPKLHKVEVPRYSWM